MTVHADDRGVPRQDHYGSGRQPWDDILDSGWAPEFAAGNVLKYLRRTKSPEHSLESARWYYARLIEMMRGETAPAGASDRAKRHHAARAAAVLVCLKGLLTSNELARLG